MTNGKPAGWKVAGDERGKLVQENGASYLAFASADVAGNAIAEARLKVDPSWKAVKVSVRMKATINALGDQP